MPSRKKPSREYRAAIKAVRDYHASRKTFTGRRVQNYVGDIRALFGELSTWPKTVLDYGCGKGGQYDAARGPTLGERLGVDTVTGYDPGVPAYDRWPEGTFDAVLCVDVLEYIPSTDVPWVLDVLFAFARSAVFISAAAVKPSKTELRLENSDRWSEDWVLRAISEALMRSTSRPVCYARLICPFGLRRLFRVALPGQASSLLATVRKDGKPHVEESGAVPPGP